MKQDFEYYFPDMAVTITKINGEFKTSDGEFFTSVAKAADHERELKLHSSMIKVILEED